MADVFVIDLDAPSARPAGASTPLDAAERERAGRFRDERDRRRYSAAHIALRELLGEARGVDPAGVWILRAPCVVCLEQDHGKPFVEGGPFFSLSRSGRWALIAISDEPVGVDVEEPQDPGRLDAIRASVLAPGESTDDLLRLWVRKEAILKTSGDGLTRSMSSFRADTGGNGTGSASKGSAGTGSAGTGSAEHGLLDHGLVDLDLPHRLVGALAFAGARDTLLPGAPPAPFTVEMHEPTKVRHR